MTSVVIITLALLALVAGALAATYYREARKWAGLYQHVRIVVAYKRKVKLDAPLEEWRRWANLLHDDERSSGRVMYSMGGTSIAILKPGPKPAPVKPLPERNEGAPVRTGAWAATDDKTGVRGGTA